ncbi:MAG: rhomboid family intramembrane serine protease [Candidatus Obscuribacterales bacterium]
MRLIGSLPTQQDALRFATFLKTQQIDCLIEKEQDYQIWIISEDHLDEAIAHLDHYKSHPDDPRFRLTPQQPPLPSADQQAALQAEKARNLRPASLFKRSPLGKVILALFILSIALYAWGLVQEAKFKPFHNDKELGLPLLPPIYTALLYDYPKALADIQHLATQYTPAQIKDPSTLTPAQQQQIKTTLTTPWFQGFYSRLVRLVQHKPPLPHGPLFQKIREGQLWRLVTPILLHGGFLHILFNLIWLWVLGNQVEERIGPWRITLLILIGAIISNTAQYLMSGPLFFGLSGIVLTLFGFIWVRQRKAPWEGYLLNKIVIAFLTIWILGIAALQVVLFFVQLTGNGLPPIGIANTAHIVGGLVGAACGTLNIFSAK